MEGKNPGGYSMPTPTRGTAKTILVLNDDCLLEVFKNLDLSDLSYAADTCYRFRQNAKACFEYSKKTELALPKDIRSGRDSFDQLMLRKSRVLRNFGEFILSFNDEGNEPVEPFEQFKSVQRVKYQRQTEELLLQYGNKNLINLKLSLFFLSEEIQPLFEPLQKLELNTVYSMASTWDMLPMWCPNLRELIFNNVCNTSDSRFHFGGFKKPFQKLVKITFNDIHHFGTKEIEETLKNNPQLKEIDLGYCIHMDDRFLEPLADHLPGIENLKISLFKKVDQINTKYFANLRNLHSLTLRFFDLQLASIYAVSIISELGTARIPLKYLDVTLLSVEPNDSEQFVDGFSKLPQLETLRLVDVNGVELYHIKNICKHLKQLSKLDLYISFPITVEDIFGLVRDSQNLQSLQIKYGGDGMEQLNFSIDTFQQLVRIVEERGEKSHLEICLIGPAFAGNIPEKVANQYRGVLSFKFVAGVMCYFWED